jgi:hypothetical protein
VYLFLDEVIVLSDLLKSRVHHSPKVGEVVAKLGHILPHIAVVLIARVRIALEASYMREQ